MMKDLLVDESGDLVLFKRDLQLVENKELTAQKVRLILSTKKGEWEYDENEGINFSAMLGKNVDIDEVLDAIRDGLRQVDETFEITEHSDSIKGRQLNVTFKAVSDNGEVIELNLSDLGSGNNKAVQLIVCDLNAENIMNEGSTLDKICVCDTDSEIINCVI